VGETRAVGGKDDSMTQHLALFDADAAVRLPEGSSVAISLPTGNGGEVTIKIATQYHTKQGMDPIPGALGFLIKGDATTIADALKLFNNPTNFCANVIAVAANAFLGPIDLVRVWECTANKTDRPFLHAAFNRGEVPRKSRSITTEDASSLFQGIFGIGDANDLARVIRAVGQYRLALDAWNAELPRSHAHLFMGIETLVPVALRRKMRVGGLNKEGVMKSFHLDPNQPEGKRNTQLDSAIRLHELFGSDAKLHKEAKAASDGYEHGFLELAEIEKLAAASRAETANCLRSAILTLSMTSATQLARLQDAKYQTVFAPFMLVGVEGEIAAAPGANVEVELDDLHPSVIITRNVFEPAEDDYSRNYEVALAGNRSNIVVRGPKVID